MGAIFVSYRRSDSLPFCRSMVTELRTYFGAASVFFDETMDGGTQWPPRIRAALGAAEAVLVVIGPQWLLAKEDASGRRRIDLKGDWVREEVLTALHRERNGDGVHILPVLIGNSVMPEAKDLDKQLAPLSHFQAIFLPNTGKPDDFDELKAQLVRCRFVPAVPPPVRTPILGKLPQALRDDDEAAFLAELAEWEIIETRESDAPGRFRRELHRLYEFASFDSALSFMNEVAERGIRQYNHHPRWQNTYNRVEIWLTTFNIGYKPSQKDVRLARVCEQIWCEIRAR
jgi:pterin-4a-carbinolamine dehydratase